LEVDAQLVNAEAVISGMEWLTKAQANQVKEFMEWLMTEMYEHARSAGNYQDVTGALRDSLSINADNVKVYSTAAEARSQLQRNQKPVIRIERDEYTGVLWAGMWYAFLVELKAGFTVITGTVDHFNNLIEGFMMDKLDANKLAYEGIKSYKDSM